MFDSSKKTIFARMSEPRRDHIHVHATDSKASKGKDKAEEKEKPARSINITEAHNGYVIKGPNWDDKGAVCESKESLLAAVDAAFPGEAKKAYKKDAKDDEKAS